MFAVFGSGIVVGAYGYHSYTAKTVSATAKRPKRDPEEWRRKYVDGLRTRVKLDESQVSSAELDPGRDQARVSRTEETRQKQETDRGSAEQNDKVRCNAYGRADARISTSFGRSGNRR